MFNIANHIHHRRHGRLYLSRFVEHVRVSFIYHPTYTLHGAHMIGMRPNPIREVLRDAIGIDSFALDGEEGFVAEAWEERQRPNVRRF